MNPPDIRAQLIANTTFLYGPSIEILTLRDDARKVQAVAVKYDPLTASWSKYLHCEIEDSMNHAISNLLKESEKEIRKKFEESGMSFPFLGESNEVVRGLALQRRESSASEGFEFVATPSTSVSETGKREEEEEEQERPSEPEVYECYTKECEEPSEEPYDEPVKEIYEQPIEEACREPVEELCREFVEEIYEPMERCEELDEAPASFVKVCDLEKVDKEEEVAAWEPELELTECYPMEDEKVEEEPRHTEEVETEPVPEPDDVWARWGIEKKHKRKTSWIDQPPASEPEPEAVEPTSDPCEEVIDAWARWGLSKKHSRTSSREIVEEPVVEKTTPTFYLPEPEPDSAMPMPEPEQQEDEWAPCRKNGKKKAKKRAVIEESKIEEPQAGKEDIPLVKECPAVEPISKEDSFECGSFTIKKVKKGKGVITDEPPPVEDCPAPEPEPTIDWLPWTPTTKKTKKDKKRETVIIEEPEDCSPTEECVPTECPAEECPAVEQVPEVESDEWGSFNIKKMDKKGKKAIFNKPPPVDDRLPPEPEPVLYSLESDFFSTKKSKKDKKRKTVIFKEPEDCPPPEACAVEECAIVVGSPDLEPISNYDIDFAMPGKQGKKMKGGTASLLQYRITEEPFPDETIEATIKASAPPLQVSDEPAINISLPPEANPPIRKTLSPTGHTVILKILHSSQTGTQALATMVTLNENSRQAIFTAVNSYIDSKTSLPTQRTRTLEIKYGIGRNGESLELSTLNEEMWPDYLDYFRKFTGFPELTVEAVDG